MDECENEEENNREKEKDKIFTIYVLVPPFIYHPTYMPHNFVKN